MNLFSISTSTHESIAANQLLHAFKAIEAQIEVLSLDCFDTLIWRKVATPTDVFYALQQQPIFKSLGLTASVRRMAEDKMRGLYALKHEHYEVTLAEIYRYACPTISDQALDAVIEEELNIEKQMCYAFHPILDLISYAASRHKKIVIVSDTYLLEKQLRQLITSVIPPEYARHIAKIFCSSDYLKSKVNGLFNCVLNTLKTPAEKILHIGDHPIADKRAASSAGLHSFQLLKTTEALEKLQRMSAWSAIFIDQSIRHQKPLLMPFQGLFAQQKTNNHPAHQIGYASLGPIMYAFAQSIKKLLIKLSTQHLSVKPLFLMRDGHLPALCYETLENCEAKRGFISRFSSYAASFRSKTDIENYLAEALHSKKIDFICRQLLLNSTLTQKITVVANEAADPLKCFKESILQPQIVEFILDASLAYRNRLMRYLKSVLELQPHDTIILIDLGYTGTVQFQLTPILKNELQVSVIGHYLLTLPSPKTHLHRNGVLSASNTDERTLSMLVNYIALFEQMCTTTGPSVIDYAEDGSPIFSENHLNLTQHQKLSAIQNECVHFIQDAERYLKSTQMNLSCEEERDLLQIELARFLFLPTQIEIEYLQEFEFDLNLGSEKVLSTFNPTLGLDDLRDRGMFFMERNLESMRTNYPAELRYMGMELSLSLMALERLKGSFSLPEMSYRRENLSIIVIKNKIPLRTEIEAIPTYDGYFSALIPIGSCNLQIGVQFGLVYQWVEIKKVVIIKCDALLGQTESHFTEDAAPYLHFDQMTANEHLYACDTPSSLMAFIANRTNDGANYALRITFRPIVKRKNVET